MEIWKLVVELDLWTVC